MTDLQTFLIWKLNVPRTIGILRDVFSGSFSDKIVLNRQLLRLKDYYYWKVLGQENPQLHKPTRQLKLKALIRRKCACAVALRLCFDLLLWINKHKIINREIIFENVYSKTRKFILKCNVRHTFSKAKYPKTTSITNLSSFSNNFLKSKVNDTFLMT